MAAQSSLGKEREAGGQLPRHSNRYSFGLGKELAASLHSPYGAAQHREFFCCCPLVIPGCVANYATSLAYTKDDNLIRNINV